MPLKIHIVGRYQFLGTDIKGRKERVTVITREIKDLWNNKLNFPLKSDAVIRAQLFKILENYDTCLKKSKSCDSLNQLFDVTKINGEWLSTEDKKLYYLQLESKGEVGYSTGQLANKNTIHPSKRIKKNTISVSKVAENYSDSDIDEPRDWDENEYEASEEETVTQKYQKSDIATKLVTATNVSTNKASKICNQLSRDGIKIPTPSQPAIYKATFREAAKLKKEMIQNLKSEQWSLHFDGKHIDKNEYQVVVLKNEKREIKLDALCLKDGKAATITTGLVSVINEFDLWFSVKILISDTTSVNTGKKAGVIVKLQKLFLEKGAEKPTFISCQHHVLDRILRLVMDGELNGATKSPNIEYSFVSELMKNYEELRQQFDNGTEKILDKSGWRDDMKFLYHLTRVFRFFKEQGYFPLINFQKIPNISNARWNSRAILALLAFILIPTTRTTLDKICFFISYQWAEFWFADQKYKNSDFEKLSEILSPYKKALQCLKNHWKQEPSVINIPRSNQCAERAVKVMQDLYAVCRDKSKLSLRFILSNKK